MSRRGHECRCCDNEQCDKCEDAAPTLLVANLTYSAGSGEIVAAAESWTQVTTTCSVPIDEVSVTRIRITNPGQDYTSPPALQFSGGSGAISSSSVTIESPLVGLSLIDGGSGYSSAPLVVVSNPPGFGQVEAAAAAAVVRGPVVSVSVTNPGGQYQTAPTIEIRGTGGLGSGATAEATVVNGQITAITVTNGGSGYPPAPQVIITGGGGILAAATAQISGSVVEVEVTNPGLYRNTKSSTSGTSFPNWPTVTIAGTASASLVFAGKVVAATATGAGYSSPPTATFVGGGGTGATAVVELEWEREHTRTAAITNCAASLSFLHCLDSTAQTYPPGAIFPPPLICPSSHAEQISWAIGVSTSAQQQMGSEIRFEGEAIWAQAETLWDVLGYENYSFEPGGIETPIAVATRLAERVLTTYARRFFSRVPPNVVYRISVPPQLEERNVSLTPTFRQYVDTKNDSYWYLESLAIGDDGGNLNVPFGQAEFVLAADGNSRHLVSGATLQFSRGEIEFGQPLLEQFTVQPQISVTLAPYFSTGMFRVTSVSVSSAGQTSAADQTISFSLPLERGYLSENGATSLPLQGVIADGSLQSVSGVDAVLIPPATLTGAELPADPFFNNASRITTGESSFVTTKSHTEPEVIGSVEPGEQGEPATLSVVLEQQEDLNGDAYWKVGSVDIGYGGSGYQGVEPVIFEVVGDSIEAIPAYGVVVLDRENPNINGAAVEEPTSGVGADLTPVVEQKQTEDGDDYWEVSGITINSGGSGYSNGERVILTTDPPEGLVVGIGDAPVIETDNAGAIVSITMGQNAQAYVQTDRVGRIQVYFSGKYFARSIDETNTPLPQVECIGMISEDNGWEKNVQQLAVIGASPNNIIRYFGRTFAVGETTETSYQATPLPFALFPVTTRTRRCAFPDIELELQ